MAHSPEHSNQCRVANASLAAHDCRYRDDVVRIGRVPHAEKKTKSNDGKHSDHLYLDRGIDTETLSLNGLLPKIRTEVYMNIAPSCIEANTRKSQTEEQGEEGKTQLTQS